MSLSRTDAEMDLRETPESEIRRHGAHEASGARSSDAKIRGSFTLVELLVVIAIIAILMALLFPAFTGVQDQAKRTQAKNDIAQIVTAVNAFHTEYGHTRVTHKLGTTELTSSLTTTTLIIHSSTFFAGIQPTEMFRPITRKPSRSFNRRSRRIWPIPGQALAGTANSTIHGAAAIASGWTTIILAQLRIRIPEMRDSIRSGWE